MLHYLVFKVQLFEYDVQMAIHKNLLYEYSHDIPSDLVEMRRIELLTPCLQGRCSPS